MVESTLAFRNGATDANKVKTQFEDSKEGARYNLNISSISGEATFPSCGPAPCLCFCLRGPLSPAPGFLLSPRVLIRKVIPLEEYSDPYFSF